MCFVLFYVLTFFLRNFSNARCTLSVCLSCLLENKLFIVHFYLYIRQGGRGCTMLAVCPSVCPSVCSEQNNLMFLPG